MNAPKTNRYWMNRHVGLELVALSIALITMLKHSALERFDALRFGSHIDAVTVCVAIAIILGMIGLLLPNKSGESRPVAFAIFAVMLLFFCLYPAFVPGN